MNFKGIIFDFNGVLLWDSHLQEEAWDKMSWELRNKPFTHEEVLTHMHGRINKDVLAYLTGRELSASEVEKLANRKEQLYREMCLANHSEFQLSPGAEDLLDYLAQNTIPFMIATASPKVNVDFYRQHLQLDKWFDMGKIVYDDGTLPGKPSPDIYLKAAAKLGLEPKDCLVVEDALSGIQSAHNAGIGTIIALAPEEKHESMTQLQGVSKVIRNLGELTSSIQ